MKKFLLLATALVISAVAMNAQDLLTKHNGEDVKVIVKEIDANNVKYVLYDEPNGVLYTMPKSEILMIRYASGRNEIFGSQSTSYNNRRNYSQSGMSGRSTNTELYVGMKYGELKDMYDYRLYSKYDVYEKYNPTTCGVCSFLIPGLGQMISGEVLRGLAFLGGAPIGSYLVGGIVETLTDSTAIGVIIWGIASLGMNIWSIVDATRVAKVKNMYETDLRSMRSSMNVDMYPSLNAIPTQSGLGVAPGMTLAITF